MTSERAQRIASAIEEFVKAIVRDETQRPEDSDVGNAMAVYRTREEFIKVLVTEEE